MSMIITYMNHKKFGVKIRKLGWQYRYTSFNLVEAVCTTDSLRKPCCVYALTELLPIRIQSISRMFPPTSIPTAIDASPANLD